MELIESILADAAAIAKVRRNIQPHLGDAIGPSRLHRDADLRHEAIGQAVSNKSERRTLLPCLVIPRERTVAPLECSPGIRPR